jgi:hypothetical protein
VRSEALRALTKAAKRLGRNYLPFVPAARLLLAPLRRLLKEKDSPSCPALEDFDEMSLCVSLGRPLFEVFFLSFFFKN